MRAGDVSVFEVIHVLYRGSIGLDYLDGDKFFVGVGGEGEFRNVLWMDDNDLVSPGQERYYHVPNTHPVKIRDNGDDIL